jgi:hypothetical protein
MSFIPSSGRAHVTVAIAKRNVAKFEDNSKWNGAQSLRRHFAAGGAAGFEDHRPGEGNS